MKTTFDIPLAIRRLRKGQPWLVAMQTQLLLMPDVGVGSTEERKFCEMLDIWDELDRKVRRPGRTPWTGCVIEGGCDPESPVVCRACGATQKKS
jgi:hypothetical protein